MQRKLFERHVAEALASIPRRFRDAMRMEGVWARRDSA